MKRFGPASVRRGQLGDLKRDRVTEGLMCS